MVERVRLLDLFGPICTAVFDTSLAGVVTAAATVGCEILEGKPLLLYSGGGLAMG